MSNTPSLKEMLINRLKQSEQSLIDQRKSAINEQKKWQEVLDAAKIKKRYFKRTAWTLFIWNSVLFPYVYVATKLYRPWEQPVYHRYTQWCHLHLLRCQGIRIKKVMNLNKEKVGQVLIVGAFEEGRAQIMHATLPFNARMVADVFFFKAYRFLGGSSFMKKAGVLQLDTGVTANLYSDMLKCVDHVKAGDSLAFGIDSGPTCQGPAFLVKQINVPIVPVWVQLSRPVIFGNALRPVDAVVVYGKPVAVPEAIRTAEKNRVLFNKWMMSEIDKLKVHLANG